jgi:hypothetical protein
MNQVGVIMVLAIRATSARITAATTMPNVTTLANQIPTIHLRFGRLSVDSFVFDTPLLPSILVGLDNLLYVSV